MEAPAQIAPGREVRLLEPADEWFVVLSIDGDLLHLARRHEGNLTAGFWIDTHAVREVRPGPATQPGRPYRRAEFDGVQMGLESIDDESGLAERTRQGLERDDHQPD